MPFSQGGGFLGVGNTMMIPKMLTLPVLLAKQEVQEFSRLQLIDSHHLLRKGVSRDTELNGVVQNGFTSCCACQTGSTHIYLPVID